MKITVPVRISVDHKNEALHTVPVLRCWGYEVEQVEGRKYATRVYPLSAVFQRP